MNTNQNLTGSSITELLAGWRNGSSESLDVLLPLVDVEMRRMARRYLRRESVHHSLQTTSLINETFLRLFRQNRISWQSRAHFFAITAKIMRRVLINHARDRMTAKRGGENEFVPLDGLELMSAEKSRELVLLDEALTRLAEIDEFKSRIVELRFFVGLTVEDTAEALGVSPNTVWVHWRFTKAWLAREIAGDVLFGEPA